MPTKNQIIEELYQSKEFNECIGKMQPQHLRDDLRSEVMLVLLETDETKLRGMYERGELRFYTVRVILNLSNSKTSTFFKKYKQFSDLIFPGEISWDRVVSEAKNPDEENEAINNREIRELKEQRAEAVIETLPWYDREIINLYRQLGSYRKIEEVTYIEAMGKGIPWQSCYSTVKKAIKKIRNELSIAHIILFAVSSFLLD